MLHPVRLQGLGLMHLMFTLPSGTWKFTLLTSQVHISRTIDELDRGLSTIARFFLTLALLTLFYSLLFLGMHELFPFRTLHMIQLAIFPVLE